jgi:hypothetical protein
MERRGGTRRERLHHQAEDQMNAAGQDGWEAFACDGCYVYLKRLAS